ncbi:DivIVA protein [Micromonospora sp. MW-13]|uniref:DivIVA domain-containing protein n=1 Tax=Micromonospora sp. MW-13 TaxID=2094022 RepID=UPI000E452967|nr:DivIVA domain-containing protein [Micromonospora sp. MW-13]RGC66122.1 DivIVA protein [Micromonospora sp. MW-13]
MRVFLRRVRRRQRAVHGPAGQRSAAYRPLLPWQVREQRFRPTLLGRRGLDPQEVGEFLDRVAGDLAAVYDALSQSRREVSRIKLALCHLRSERAHTRNEREWDR